MLSLRKGKNYNTNWKKNDNNRTRPSEANDFFTLLVPPSSLPLLPPRPYFLLVQQDQHCINHLESVKVHFSSILTKPLPTNQRTDRRTRPLIEIRTHLKTETSLVDASLTISVLFHSLSITFIACYSFIPYFEIFSSEIKYGFCKRWIAFYFL